MRVRSASLILFSALAVAAPASAATPILGPADGVQASRSGAALTIHFTGDSGKRAGVIGKEVIAICSRHPATPGLAFVDEARAVPAKPGTVAADGTAQLRFERDVPVDSCEVSSLSSFTTVARVALTADGEAWVDESIRATALHALLDRAHGTGGYRPLAALGAGLVALDGPEGTPAVGETGYWTDGTRTTVATLSATGRRLAIQDLGRGVVRSNVLGQGDPLSYLVDPTAGLIGTVEQREPETDGSPSPYRGAHPLRPHDGVRGTSAGRRVAVRFTGRSAKTLRALAGRHVLALCIARPATAPFPSRASAAPLRRAVTRVPRRGGVLRFTLVKPVDLCFLSDDGSVLATTPVSETGRRWMADIRALDLLVGGSSEDTDRFAPTGATAYWPTATIVAHGRKELVAMSSPGARVPAGRVGVWTDGARQATEAIVSPTGRRFFLTDEGDGMVRTNLFGELNVWALVLTDTGD